MRNVHLIVLRAKIQVKITIFSHVLYGYFYKNTANFTFLH